MAFPMAGYHGSMRRNGITRVKPGFVWGEAVQYRKLKEKFQCKEEFGHNWWGTIKRKLDGCAGYLLRLLLLLRLVKHWLFARRLWAPSLLIISFHCQNSSIRLVLLTHPYYRWESWGKRMLSSLFEAVQVVGGIYSRIWIYLAHSRFCALNHLTIHIICMDPQWPFSSSSSSLRALL